MRSRRSRASSSRSSTRPGERRGLQEGRARLPAQGARGLGRGGAKHAMRLFVANFPVRKAEDFGARRQVRAPAARPERRRAGVRQASRLVKWASTRTTSASCWASCSSPRWSTRRATSTRPRRSRAAAHRFMEDFGGLGLMHRLRVNGQVKVLESYPRPPTSPSASLAVRKGTWARGARALRRAVGAREVRRPHGFLHRRLRAPRAGARSCSDVGTAPTTTSPPAGGRRMTTPMNKADDGVHRPSTWSSRRSRSSTAPPTSTASSS